MSVDDRRHPTSGLQLCADELAVSGGVGWSYDRRRRRRGFMVGGGGVGGVRQDERALNTTLAGQAFFLVLQGSATSPVISARPLAPKS